MLYPSSAKLRCQYPIALLRFQHLPPGQHPLHQGPHTQLAGDGQRLVQQRDCLGTVARSIPLSQGVSVVAADPGQLRQVACVAAEGEEVSEVGVVKFISP